MAVTDRLRRTRYDNIAVGEATGLENNITETVSPQERYGGGLYTSTSNGDELVGHTNVAAGTSVSDDNVGPENMTAAVDPTDENVG